MTEQQIAELEARLVSIENLTGQAAGIEWVPALECQGMEVPWLIATIRALRTALVERENTIDDMLRCVGKNACNITDPIDAIKSTYRSLVAARRCLAERDRQIAGREALDKENLAAHLQIGWRRYVELLGEPPHGTLNQLRAMLELCRLDEIDAARSRP